MISRTGMLLALMAVALLLVPSSCSAAEGSDSSYVSQLDENGRSVYGSLSVFETSNDAVLEITAGFPRTVLYQTEDAAKIAAAQTVNDALAAKYLSDPYGIWLWDLPVKSVEVVPEVAPMKIEGDQKAYYAATSVSFKLSAPEKYQSDVASILDEVKKSAKTFNGSDSDKAKAIAKHLSGISKEDGEGTVSDLYDAIVKRSASSFGVAAAYTYLAGLNDLEAVTVKGLYYGTSDEGKSGCWNAVRTGDAWYAVDATKNMIMSGTGTKIGSATFASSYSADLDMKDDNSLVPPEIGRTAYPYPDETPFLEKYGAHILVALMVAVVLISLLYGVRKGYA